MHVTCIAHLIHSCVMRARTHFKKIDNLITSLKAATIKNKDRQNDSREPGLPAPPDPVLTGWSNWLIAGFYYSEHLPKVQAVVNNWKNNRVLVKKAKEAINNTTLVAGLVQICQYQSLVDSVQQQEGLDCTIMKTYRLFVICNLKVIHMKFYH